MPTEDVKYDPSAIEQDVLQSAPKTMRSRAERLLQRIRSHPDVTWNPRDEIEYQGQLVKNSNLTDLVNDVLRKRRNIAEHVGWKTFALLPKRRPQWYGKRPRHTSIRGNRGFKTPCSGRLATFVNFIIIMKRKTKRTNKKNTKQNKLLGQAYYTTKRPSAYGGVGALKRATKLK